MVFIDVNKDSTFKARIEDFTLKAKTRTTKECYFKWCPRSYQGLQVNNN
jgi:hypothetical protein